MYATLLPDPWNGAGGGCAGLTGGGTRGAGDVGNPGGCMVGAAPGPPHDDGTACGAETPFAFMRAWSSVVGPKESKVCGDTFGA